MNRAQFFKMLGLGALAAICGYKPKRKPDVYSPAQVREARKQAMMIGVICDLQRDIDELEFVKLENKMLREELLPNEHPYA